LNWGFEVECIYNGAPSATIDVVRALSTSSEVGWVTLRQITSGNFEFSVYDGTNNSVVTYSSSSIQTGDRVKFVCKQLNYSLRTMDVYVNGVKSGNTLSSTAEVNTSTTTFANKNRVTIGGNALRTDAFKGSINLNAFKIYVDGNLVYQPCLKIPYTLSKTGSKVVNAMYRPRVNDMAEQFGYANYYTLNENKANNYTVVGSPTITDGVASGFSSSNYLTTIYSGTTKDFEVLIPFTVETLDATHNILGQMLYLYANGRFVSDIGDGTKYGNVYATVNTNYLAKIKLKNGYHSLNISIDNGANWVEVFNVVNTNAYTFNNITIGCYNNYNYFKGSIDLNSLKIYVDNKLAYKAIQPPCFTLPQAEVYGLIQKNTSEIATNTAAIADKSKVTFRDWSVS
jgi:hypothetical protein